MYSEYIFRKCCNSWRYCNGDCNNCTLTKATYSTTTKFTGNTCSNISEKMEENDNV